MEESNTNPPSSPNPPAPPAEKPDPYLIARPRKWKNKRSGKFFKVLPWFQPLSPDTKFDLVGLMKDVAPELFTDDVMAGVELFDGLVMKLGYQVYNENNVWICIPQAVESEFEDLGLWDTELDGPGDIGIPRKRKKKKKATAKRRRG